MVPYLHGLPTFLPMTIAAIEDSGARELREHVHAADTAAGECWNGLLAGCNAPGRRALPGRLRVLSAVVGEFAGHDWWMSDGIVHRRRVLEAQLRIDGAVSEGDGAEFAEAFVGYDQAVATVVVNVANRLGTS
ncbi:sugar ABC transporter substrate-binding protein [Pseudonocardiaceae bacterium YIM PH 21723]|nr:sugar ABC transporter substrate-binding protein [Pseudonocardiaceae bacterium YIM PH 21723]